MEKLWSPWRSQYIESFKNEDENKGCIFCGVDLNAKEEGNSLIVYKGKLCYVVLNLYPYNSGHMMVVPYKHTSDLTELSPSELSEMMECVQISIKSLEEVMKPQGFNFGANLGKAAGAGIDAHIHFHILPRWIGDTNFMPVIGEVKVISQDLIETRDKIVVAFSKISKSYEGK